MREDGKRIHAIGRRTRTSIRLQPSHWKKNRNERQSHRGATKNPSAGPANSSHRATTDLAASLSRSEAGSASEVPMRPLVPYLSLQVTYRCNIECKHFG